jgi:hypothetical protein
VKTVSYGMWVNTTFAQISRSNLRALVQWGLLWRNVFFISF